MKVKRTISIFLFSIVISLLSSMTNDNFWSYGQTLENKYDNQKCGIVVQFPSDWKSEETQDSPGIINYIVEFQPNNEEGFNNVVGIELIDISSLQDRTFEGIKGFEEESLSLDEESGIIKIESSEPAQIAGFPAQRIVYNELISGDKKMDIFTVAFDREYKITYDANTGNYEKYVSTFEEMTKTFKIIQPSFEGIIC